MRRVRIFAFAVACVMVAPQADAQGNRGTSNGVPGSISNIQAIIDQGQTGSVQVWVNGAPIAEGLNFGGGTTTLRDQSADVTWPLGVGDTMEIRVLSAGAIAYGAWRHPATGAAQSRLQIEYLGPPVALAPPPPPPSPEI